MVAVGRGGQRSNEASLTPSGTSLMIWARTPRLQGFAYSWKREGLVAVCIGKSMAAQSVEEELAELAELVREAERLGSPRRKATLRPRIRPRLTDNAGMVTDKHRARTTLR